MSKGLMRFMATVAMFRLAVERYGYVVALKIVFNFHASKFKEGWRPFDVPEAQAPEVFDPF